MSQPRIVSLISSATEIVCALGWGDCLVGRSHECDFPEWVQRLPACSQPRIDIHADSRSIDEQVKASLRNGLSIYDVFTDELNRLAPTHIITQSQCEVCAVSLADVQRAVCDVVASQPEVISLEPIQLADLWRDIRQVAGALGDPARGDKLVGELQVRLERVRRKVAGARSLPTIVCLEWLSPLMSAGNWVPELVEIAGGQMLLAEAGKHSPYFTWEQLLAADPEVIVVLPCGFDIPRTMSELEVVTSDPRWPRLRAVRSGRVSITDGNQFFNRPGPRLVESAEILAEILHPELFAPGEFRHQGRGWVKQGEKSDE